MKKCPFCAEDIQDAAIKCKHCGEMLAEAININQTPEQRLLDFGNIAIFTAAGGAGFEAPRNTSNPARLKTMISDLKLSKESQGAAT